MGQPGERNVLLSLPPYAICNHMNTTYSYMYGAARRVECSHLSLHTSYITLIQPSWLTGHYKSNIYLSILITHHTYLQSHEDNIQLHVWSRQESGMFSSLPPHIIYHPDTTFMVDWALQIKYLSIYPNNPPHISAIIG